MIVVSDTSPINYLVWIGHVELLRGLFGAVAPSRETSSVPIGRPETCNELDS